MHDSQVAIDLVKHSKRAFPNLKCVVADARYKNSKFVHFLAHLKLYPVLPYTSPLGVKGMFRKNDFVYDNYFDCYLCPNNQPLLFSTITREGYRTYKSNPKFCMSCPLLESCTLSEKYQKVVIRHIWADLMDELERQHHKAFNREIYKKRKQTIERIVADAKEKHGMRWTNYRGIEKVATYTMLKFAAMNVKKLATWLWKVEKPMAFQFKFIQRIVKRRWLDCQLLFVYSLIISIKAYLFFINKNWNRFESLENISKFIL